MSISFRSYLQIDCAFDLLFDGFVELFETDIKRTLRKLNIEFSSVDFTASQVITISPELELVTTKTSEFDSFQSFRVRIAEIKSANRWVTQYSIHQSIVSPKESTLVIEIDSPANQYSRQPIWPQIPRLVTNLIERFAPRDLGVPIGTPTCHKQKEEVPNLIRYLEDPKRRATLVAAVNLGSDNWDEYTGLMRQVLRETGGTSTAVILDTKTADYFNEKVPSTYAISGEYFRIFNPHLNFSEIYQAHRHKKYLISDLDEKGIEKVSKDIATITRNNSLNRSFPLSIQKRERIIDALEQNVLAHGKRNTLVPPNIARDIQSETNYGILNPKLSANEIAKAVKEFRLQIGKNFIEPNELIELAMNTKRLDSMSTELKKVNEERDDLSLAIMELREDLDDEALGKLELFEQKSKLEAEIRYLRESLVNTRNADLAYESMPEGQYEPLPLTFQEVLERFDAFNFVIFTGDPWETTQLDDVDTGSSAPHCWEYLQVLDDYARAKALKAFDNNFMQFLKNTPSGFKTMSSHKYAPVESEQTANRRALLDARTFNVPVEVDSSGKALMESHLKLSRRIRIHFLDHTRVTGKVYVGFIGNHLPLVG